MLRLAGFLMKKGLRIAARELGFQQVLHNCFFFVCFKAFSGRLQSSLCRFEGRELRIKSI